MDRYRNVQSFALGAALVRPLVRVVPRNWKNRLRAFLAIALCLPPLCAPAAASATYQWRTISGSGCCEAILEITNEAYAAGAVSSHIQHAGAPLALAGTPVIRFELTGYGDRVVFDRERVRGVYDFDVSLVGGSLSGQIRVNDLSTDTLLSGGEDQWMVKEHHADHPGDCFQAVNKCSGATGRWVLVSPPTE
jgi:hypothetical protein